MKEFIFKISCISLENKHRQTKETIVVSTTKSKAVHRLEKCKIVILDYLGFQPITLPNLYAQGVLETYPYETGK